MLLAVSLSVLIMIGWTYLSHKFNPRDTKPADGTTQPARQSADRGQTPTATAPGDSPTGIATAPTQAHSQPGTAPADATLEHVLLVVEDPELVDNIVIGGDGPDSDFKLRVHLSNRGAVVTRAEILPYKWHVDKEAPYPLLNPVLAEVDQPVELGSFITEKLFFPQRDQVLRLDEAKWLVVGVRQEPDMHEAVFEARIYQGTFAHEAHVLTVRKTYRLHKAVYDDEDQLVRGFDLDMHIDIINHTDSDERVVITQFGPAGIHQEGTRMDQRHAYAAVRNTSNTGAALERIKASRKDVMKTDTGESLLPDDKTLVWVGEANQYFAALTVPLARDGSGQVTSEYIAHATAITLTPMEEDQNDLTTRLTTTTLPVLAGKTLHVPFETYLGPKKESIFESPAYKDRHYELAVEHRPCSFAWLAKIMGAMLSAFHVVVHNYGIAIIVLVLLVRTLLHPVTKYQQVNMMKMQENMERMKPKLEALKEKYGDNREAFNKAQLELMQKEGMNPASQMMGCLPMFLQIPIWIALWETLNNTFELRHAPFVLWINDLSSPDALFPFDQAVNLPLMGEIHGLNLLPLLLSVSMILQQRFMVKRRSGRSNEQIAQQQKIMYIMSIVFMFIFYKMPSGLCLYILTSNVVGALEQKVIRDHMEKESEQGPPAGGDKEPPVLKKASKKPKVPRSQRRFT